MRAMSIILATDLQKFNYDFVSQFCHSRDRFILLRQTRPTYARRPFPPISRRIKDRAVDRHRHWEKNGGDSRCKADGQRAEHAGRVGRAHGFVREDTVVKVRTG